MFSSLFLVFVIGAALLFFFVVKQLKSSDQARDFSYPYEKQLTLFTPAERSFLGVLERSLEGEYKIFGKVRLADVIKVQRGLSNSERQSALNRINHKHLDFVICTIDTLELVCAIELDDKSHSAKDRKERDVFLDKALGAAGVPIIRFPAKRAYELAEVQGKLKQSLSAVTPMQHLQSQVEVQANDVDSKRDCPKCGAELVVKVAKRGKNAGQEFLACSAYPSCKTAFTLG